MGSGVGCGCPGAVVVRVGWVLGDRDRLERGEDPLAQRRAALGREPADRGEDRRRGRWSGAWTDSPLSLNATTPMTTPGGWRATNSRAAAFAASIRVGSKSVGGHAPRHVEREDHGPLQPRQADRRPAAGASASARIPNPAISSAPGSRWRTRRGPGDTGAGHRDAPERAAPGAAGDGPGSAVRRTGRSG